MTLETVNDIWTQDRIDLLKELWGKGYSASQIASEINKDSRYLFTRNAVIGKINRLGLSGRRKVVDLLSRQKPGPKKARISRRHNFNPANNIERQEQAKIIADGFVEKFDEAQARDAAAVPIEQRKTLLQLTNSSCRWPFGDVGSEGFFFCGADEANVAENRPYCSCHARLSSSGAPRRETEAHRENRLRAVRRAHNARRAAA